MKNTSLYALQSAATAGLAITDASALAVGAVYPPAGAVEASVPAAFAPLVWGPIVVLMFVLGLSLLWLLRTPAAERKTETRVRRAPVRKPRLTRRLRVPALAQRRLHRHLDSRAPLPV